MIFAADYPFLDVLWTTVIIFAGFIWLMLLFRVFVDLFRQHDMGGGKKVLWFVFVIAVPFLGVFVYLLAHGQDMADRDVRASQSSQREFDDHVRSVASEPTGNPAAQIEQGKQLLDSGTITPAEFEALKAKALA